MSERTTQSHPRARILIVDDHPIVRQGLVALISKETDLTVCGEAESAQEATRLAKELVPALMLIDLTLNDQPGLELIKTLHAEHPEVRLLVLSMHEESVWAERVLRAGACGYVMKREKPRVLIGRIHQALAGGLALSERVAERMVRRFTGQVPTGTGPASEGLGDRELEVLELIGQGKSLREIASTLHISVKTVEAHRENLKRKLRLGSAAELLRYAVLRSVEVGK